jgi:hypothetical protein
MPFWKAVKDNLWKAWQATVENWLLHHAHVCLTFCALLSVAFLGLGLFEARVLESLSARLLSSPTEATPHRFGGLEAFVLDGFAGKILPKDLPPNVMLASNQIDEEIKGSLRKPDSIVLHVHPRKAGTLKQQYISDDDDTVFLFLPAIALANLRSETKPLPPDASAAELGIREGSLLANDISVGIAASPGLQDLLKASFDENTKQRFTQVYLVSATGALRDFNDGGSDDNSFIAHRFFPERPYFWPTIEHASSELKCPQPFSFCTRPYVDLGGHGIVVTMCRIVQARPDISDTTLCGDISFPATKTKEVVADEVDPFSTAVPREIGCSIDGSGIRCENASTDNDSQAVEAALKTVVGMGRSEEMLGGIYKLSDDITPAHNVGVHSILMLMEKVPYIGAYVQKLFPVGEGTSFAFTMPVDVTRAPGKQSVTFLLCSVDFAHPTLLLVISVIGGTISAAGLFLSIFYSFQARRKSFEFIASLEDVMKACPVPFVHLSEDGKVIGANCAFQKLVDADSQKLETTTFFSLLDQKSQARYKIVAKCRRDKLLTRPYEITLVNKDLAAGKVVVSGSALDMPRTSEFNIAEPAATFLHTFGIVVPRTMISEADFKSLGVLEETLNLAEFEVLLAGSAHKATTDRHFDE